MGTSFPQVADRGGTGAALSTGAAERVVWALVQMVNSVHRYFLAQPLIGNAEASRLARHVEINREQLEKARTPRQKQTLYEESIPKTREHFRSILERLHKALRLHMPRPGALPEKIDPGIVTGIEASIFGFSRGATQARAFANWLVALCALDAGWRERAAV